AASMAVGMGKETDTAGGFTSPSFRPRNLCHWRLTCLNTFKDLNVSLFTRSLGPAYWLSLMTLVCAACKAVAGSLALPPVPSASLCTEFRNDLMYSRYNTIRDLTC